MLSNKHFDADKMEPPSYARKTRRIRPHLAGQMQQRWTVPGRGNRNRRRESPLANHQIGARVSTDMQSVHAEEVQRCACAHRHSPSPRSRSS